MKKGWIQKRICEHAWDLCFTRWYFIAPSGNKYFMWRDCYFNRINIPKTYNALISSNTPVAECEIEKVRPLGNPVDGYKKRSIYQQAIQYLYKIEEQGGFPEQQKMNGWLNTDREMNSLLNRTENAVSYHSMP